MELNILYNLVSSSYMYAFINIHTYIHIYIYIHKHVILCILYTQIEYHGYV